MKKPHLILAGPGTGKTTFLINKTIELFKNVKEKNDGIIICTFTRKATEELTTRLYSKLSISEINKVKFIVGTIHSICYELLARFSENDYNDFQILPEESQVHFIHSKLKNLGYSNERIKKNGWLLSEELAAIFNKINDEELEIGKLNFGDDIELEEACLVFPTYQKLLKRNKLFDFASIQSTFLNELYNSNGFHEKILESFSNFLIDEFQDINDIQNKIFIKLSEPNFKLTVVGDDDQSIYGFRGSRVEHIRNFKPFFNKKGISVLQDVLNVNYRSTNEIVNFTNEILQNSDFERFDKMITAHRNGISHKPVVKQFSTEEAEINFIIDTINELTNRKIIRKYNQIAILFRSLKSHSGNLANALKVCGIPYKVVGAGNFFESILGLEVIALIDYFLAKDLQKEILFFDALANIDLKFNTDITTTYTCRDYLKKLDEFFAKKKYFSCIDLLYDLMILTDFFKRYESEGNNIGKLTELVLTFDEFSTSFDPWGLFSYLIYLKGSQSVDYNDVNLDDCISLMTIHQSKGLEFPIVFLPSQIERSQKKTIVDRLDSLVGRNLSSDGEETRVLYVGCTRAEDLLIITGSNHLKSTNKTYNFKKEILRSLKTADISNELDFNILQSQIFRGKSNSTKEVITLSYNKISLYNQCPLAYKYAHVWNLQTVRIGGLEFGRNIHKIIEVLLRGLLNGAKIETIDIECLIEENWRNTNFRSDVENNKFKKAAQEQVKNYLKNSVHLLKKERIFSVEDQFNISVDGNLITGRFDAIFQDEDSYIIVDFKTGGKSDYTSQLSFYSLCFKEKYAPNKRIKLAVYYLKDAEYSFIDSYNEQLELYKINNVAKLIKENLFNPKPGSICKNCAFNNICEFAL